MDLPCPGLATGSYIHRHIAEVYGTEAVIAKFEMLVDCMPQGTTVNSDAFCAALRKLRRVLLLHDNARPPTSRTT
ncbi:hypothetical protein TNCV_664451 [Trichonephila clavipes]|nr:hypothetical protein TNCV_664451 [Trichonephila clavipes]